MIIFQKSFLHGQDKFYKEAKKVYFLSLLNFFEIKNEFPFIVEN